MPKGVINVVSCSRENAASIGQLFCEDPKVATVSFTGSCEVGKVIQSMPFSVLGNVIYLPNKGPSKID